MSKNNSKCNILMNSLNIFYKDKDNLQDLITIIKDKKISLRIIDWFVTNYSKKKNIILQDNFNVYIDYKLQLKGY